MIDAFRAKVSCNSGKTGIYYVHQTENKNKIFGSAGIFVRFDYELKGEVA